MHRRLQTAAILLVAPLQFYALIFSLILFVNPFTFPFMVAYLVWIYYIDKSPMTGVRKWEFMRRLGIWRLASDYFPVSITKTADLDPNQHYLFGYHPHGIISIGAFVTFATEAVGFSQEFPGIDCRLLGLAPMTRIPFGREILLWLGVGNVDRKACEHHLNNSQPGRSIAIVVGGAQEALDAIPNTLKLTIANRKGFVRVALHTGASLVPVLCFGENELFEQVQHPLLRKVQDALQERMGFSLPLFLGRGVLQYSFGLLPHRQPIHVVFGTPISCLKTAEPTQEQVDEVHAQYLCQLRQLFDDHKDSLMPKRKDTLVFAEAHVHPKKA